jgi:hypothetical protein
VVGRAAFSGNTVEGLAWIEEGIGDHRATGSIMGMSYYLALKSEALHLAGRTPEALETINGRMQWPKGVKSVGGVLNYTGCAVYFSRLLVPTRSKLRLRSAQPLESRRNRSRFR